MAVTWLSPRACHTAHARRLKTQTQDTPISVAFYMGRVQACEGAAVHRMAYYCAVACREHCWGAHHTGAWSTEVSDNVTQSYLQGTDAIKQTVVRIFREYSSFTNCVSPCVDMQHAHWETPHTHSQA